jgi:AraC-like DNA-binding protein
LLTYAVHYRIDLLPPTVAGQLAALGFSPIDLRSSVGPVRVVRSLFQEMLFEQNGQQEGWELILRCSLIHLAIRFLRLTRRGSRSDLPEPDNDSVQRVARYALRLRSQLFRPGTVVEAAQSVGLSRRQFAELFHKVTSQSWRRYLQDLRLKRAAEFLTETDRPVSAVAFESGFEDLSNFHHSFKRSFGCSPLSYREQRRVCLSSKAILAPEVGQLPARFKFRGMKGWSWTLDQYLEEIPILPQLKLNFLMNCYRSMSVSAPKQGWCNNWRKPMSMEQKQAFSQIICKCRDNNVTFCFALHPFLGCSQAFDPASTEGLEIFYQHYSWAQAQGVQWFCVCLDETSWGVTGPARCGATHASLVNGIIKRLRASDSDAQLILCPTAFWGDGSNPEHRAYLGGLARELHPDVYVFWNGDAIVTPRITRVAAENYKHVVNHRLFLWDNYPVNDGNPTLNLGPLSGREANLFEAIDGYVSNPMCTQNDINRIPLATCADYASNPRGYNPARSIDQAILRFSKTNAQQQVLKDLVEAYPGFIVAGGGTGTNPVRAKIGGLLAKHGSVSAAREFISQIEDVSSRLAKLFPGRYAATRKTLSDDIEWMRQQLRTITGNSNTNQ